MDIHAEDTTRESDTIERRLRDEVSFLDPYYRDNFSYALFDKKTFSLHGIKYSLHYNNGKISIR